MDTVEVPDEVEDYLINLFAANGELGGGLGGAVGAGGPGLFGGSRGGARGGARAARRMTTVVADSCATASGMIDEVMERISAAHPRILPLRAQVGLLRFVVPLGMTGLQRIVIDLTFADPLVAGSTVWVRGYGKEGLLSRRPTTRTADEIARLVAGW